MKTVQNILTTRQVTPVAERQAKWHLIDAKDRILGRLATEVADLLRGKYKADWSPMQDIGDHVVVINAAKVKLSGNKLETKEYYRHSTYPGHLKVKTYKDLIMVRPEEVIRRAVNGMLPKNNLRGGMLKRLHAFKDDKHDFAAKIK